MSPDERELADRFYLDVWELDGGRCCVTGRPALRRSPALERHHVVAKGRLRRDGLPADLVWDPANGMLVDWAVHVRHTDAIQRIPYWAIPERAFVWAKRYGYLHVLENGVHYPKGASNGKGSKRPARRPDRTRGGLD